MLNDIGAAALTILAGVVGLATISVIIGQNSQAPAAIQATGGAFATIIAAAVNPSSTAATNGNPAASTQGGGDGGIASQVSGALLGSMFGGA